MATLWFVGLGLDDERGLSRRAREVLAESEVFAEEYTAVASPGSLERLAGELGRPVTRLGREEVEGESALLEALGRSASVALVIVGDPFAATTHVALRLAVERAGHDWRYLPNASIAVAAAGFLGFSPYRFGRIVSLPFPAPGFEPRSPVEQIAANRAQGLHSLVLLDLAPQEGRYLRAEEALAILRARDPAGVALPEGDPVAVAARVGRPSAAGFFGPVRRLRALDFGPPPHALIVPALPLHFEEEAALARFRRD